MISSSCERGCVASVTYFNIFETEIKLDLTMEIYFIIALVGIIAMSVASYVVGKRNGGKTQDDATVDGLRQQLEEQRQQLLARDARIEGYIVHLRNDAEGFGKGCYKPFRGPQQHCGMPAKT